MLVNITANNQFPKTLASWVTYEECHRANISSRYMNTEPSHTSKLESSINPIHMPKIAQLQNTYMYSATSIIQMDHFI